MEDEEDMTPFWLQNRPSNNRRKLRRSTSSLLLNSGVLLIVLLVVAAAFIFIIIPSFLSFTSQIFRPHLVKKSWDKLNLVLVLFAIVCGFLSRNNNNNNNGADHQTSTPTSAYEDYNDAEKVSSRDAQKSNPETPQKLWYDNEFSSDHVKVYNNGTLSRLRSFSSYPDLRQEEASWARSSDGDRWRFYDDTRLHNYRYSRWDDQQQQWRPQQKLEVEKNEVVDGGGGDNDDHVKNIGVDSAPVVKLQKEVEYTPPPPPEESPPTPPSPPPVPPPKVVRRRKVVRRTYQDVAKDQSNPENTRKSIDDLEVVPSSIPAPPRAESPPPPSPPPLLPAILFEESGKNEKKRGGTSATKEFLNTLRRNKKKKQRQKSVENLDSFFNYEASFNFPSIPPPSQPPPPPPPPPPPFFRNLFSSKKKKSKKTHSDHSVPPPPPPPPPPRAKRHSLSASSSTSASTVVSKNVSFPTQKPPLPVKVKAYTNVDETTNSGSESPLMNSIPPPPPLPPFKMSAWKYEVHGDFIRLKSNLDDPEESSSPSDGGDATMSPFCPSPDVNTKADNFIARFRAGLVLERMNSAKEKEAAGRGRSKSNLGLQPAQSQDPEEEEGPS